MNFAFSVKRFNGPKLFFFVLLDPLGYPDLDERLPRNPKPIRLPDIGNQSSTWENQHSTFAVLEQGNRFRHVEDLGNILSLLALPFKLLRPHKPQRLPPGTGGRT